MEDEVSLFADKQLLKLAGQGELYINVTLWPRLVLPGESKSLSFFSLVDSEYEFRLHFNVIRFFCVFVLVVMWSI